MRGFILSSFLLILTACSVPKSATSADKWEDSEELVPATDAWTPGESKITCKDGPCPGQVGLIVYVFPAHNGVHKLRRCTGFLIASDVVMTNGHCDFDDEAAGYFVTAEDSPVGRQSRLITKLLSKRYTPNLVNSKLDSGRPDVATFKLEQPIRGLAPLSLAGPSDPTYSSLTGFVVSRKKDQGYEIEKISCEVRRHEAFFPFDVKDSPDVIYGFGCAVRQGNSGAPLFAPGSMKVQAVVQGVGREEGGSRLYENHKTIAATNVRCLTAGSACTPADPKTVGQSFQLAQEKAVDGLMNREYVDAENKDLRYKAAGYFQIDSADPNELKFEMVYFPDCHRGGAVPKKIRLVSELVRIRIDDWARLSTVTGGYGYTDGEVTASAENSHQVKVQWFEGFGRLVRPQDHPRSAWGPVFPIDIPKCPS